MSYISQCKCGSVRFQATADPVCNVVCYCTDCQDAGTDLEANLACINPCEADGGTAFSTFLEKDWQCVIGANKLKGHQLTPKSPTTRYVTTCCQTVMYLKYAPGFWVSTYRQPFTTNLPSLQWRIKTSHRVSDRPYPDNIARFKGFPLRLYAALFKAKWSR